MILEHKGKRIICWFLTVFLILFYWMSLASYSPSQSNWCGILGRYVSDFFIQVFGFFSYLVPVVAVLYVLFRSGRLGKVKFISTLLVIFSAILIFSSFHLSKSHYPYVENPGGALGEVLFSSLSRYLGRAGYYALSLSALFVALVPWIRFPSSFLRKVPPSFEKPKKPSGKKPQRSPVHANESGGYKLPPTTLLDSSLGFSRPSEEELSKKARLIEEKLRDFNVDGKVVNVRPGPVVTTFEYKPAPGVKISKISSLQDDLAMALQAFSLRIIAPIPGKSVVGLEVPNDKRETVFLRDVVESQAFKRSSSLLTLALGKNIFGEPYVADLSKMPHLLIAGATGSGKSVSLNAMILSILFKASPKDVKFIMIDPKMLELSSYEGIPHLLHPVVVDPKKASNALVWAVHEMERRYSILSEAGVRDISSYNSKVSQDEKIPYVVIVVDELADLIMVSSKEVEESITRLAQMARASGIHMIVATQRPSVDVISGLIKANFPTRISFKVSSKADSKTILDGHGAERLLGMGDMLFIPPGESRPVRLHGPFVSEEEVERVASFVRAQGRPEYISEITVGKEEMESPGHEGEEVDELFDEAVRFAREMGHISVSLVQRRFRIGYNRAARIVEEMERKGIVGPSDGVKPRKVLVK